MENIVKGLVELAKGLGQDMVNVEGVDYIADIKVSEDNETWVSVDELEYNEIASVQASHITVVKVEN